MDTDTCYGGIGQNQPRVGGSCPPSVRDLLCSTHNLTARQGFELADCKAGFFLQLAIDNVFAMKKQLLVVGSTWVGTKTHSNSIETVECHNQSKTKPNPTKIQPENKKWFNKKYGFLFFFLFFLSKLLFSQVGWPQTTCICHPSVSLLYTYFFLFFIPIKVGTMSQTPYGVVGTSSAVGCARKRNLQVFIPR